MPWRGLFLIHVNSRQAAQDFFGAFRPVVILARQLLGRAARPFGMVAIIAIAPLAQFGARLSNYCGALREVAPPAAAIHRGGFDLDHACPALSAAPDWGETGAASNMSGVCSSLTGIGCPASTNAWQRGWPSVPYCPSAGYSASFRLAAKLRAMMSP